MEESDWLAKRFQENRAHLRAVASRMLGSLIEADDAVQEVWLRLSRSDTSEVSNLGGWLTTVVARVCLDMLRSRRARREEFLSERVPEPPAGSQDMSDPEGVCRSRPSTRSRTGSSRLLLRRRQVTLLEREGWRT